MKTSRKSRQYLPDSGAILRQLWILRMAPLTKIPLQYYNFYATYTFSIIFIFESDITFFRLSPAIDKSTKNLSHLIMH